jgi:Adenosine-deaminase (editase) domain
MPCLPSCGILPDLLKGKHVPTAMDVEDVRAPQAMGVVRRKPGRGDPTLSMSCSDKLMRWSCLGVQACTSCDYVSLLAFIELLRKHCCSDIVR